ncbi:MAG: hypothetical protein QM570_06955 [Planctomycetota bacterium]|nr:hypothetical protein [Planctomycetota bacterium]
MSTCRMMVVAIALVLMSATAWGADVILNEYNAVGGSEFLNGGDSAVDEDGGRASDRYFGRVQGNGGDWFELVVITDHLDMRGWHLDIFEGGALDETLTLTDHAIWSDLRSGTILTVAEDVPSDISYNPAAGDWWINVQANNDADGLYIEASSFPVSSNNWQLRIRDAAGAIVFGPAGEGISPVSGISSTEVFRLEEDPDATITPYSNDYDDGSDFSTFGSANRWGSQDLVDLRVVEPIAASISLTDPNGGEFLVAGTVTPIQWESDEAIEQVLIEFSFDGGASWMAVFPANVGNSGLYEWTVPPVDSEQCLVRVSSATQLSAYDTSDEPFAIVMPLSADE